MFDKPMTIAEYGCDAMLLQRQNRSGFCTDGGCTVVFQQSAEGRTDSTQCCSLDHSFQPEMLLNSVLGRLAPIDGERKGV